MLGKSEPGFMFTQTILLIRNELNNYELVE